MGNLKQEIAMITLYDYTKRLKLHNWNYQNASNAVAWKVGHDEHEALIKLSYTNRDFRTAFLKAKKEARK